MIRSILEGRALARAAIAGLAIGLVVLAGLAVWGTASTTRATAHVRALNEVSDAWGKAFQQVNIDQVAMDDYLEAGGDRGREPLNVASTSEPVDLVWITQYGDGDNARLAAIAEASYRTYTDTLREILAAAGRGDNAAVARQGEQAQLTVATLHKQIGVGIDRTRLATTRYLEGVDRANQRLALSAKTTAGIDFALLLLCLWVLLGYQRRVERQAARSSAERDTVVALSAAPDRDAAIQTGLTVALDLGSNVAGAAIAIGIGPVVRLFGIGDSRDGCLASFPVKVADLPDAAATALRSGDSIVLGEKEGAKLADVMRLPPRTRFIMAPLLVQQDAIGLLIMAFDSRPARELTGAAATLACDVAFTLDKLRISDRLRVIVEHSSDLLFLTGGDMRLRFANPAAEAAVGQSTSALVGSSLLSLIHPDDHTETFADIDTSDGATARVCRLRRGDGEWMQVEMTIGRVQERDGSISLVMNTRDMSDRHRLEMELRHAQRLESVGRLAAGIAHEINTPVQFIGDNVRFLESSFTDLLSLREMYGSVLDATQEPATLAASVAAVRAAEADLDVDFVVEEVPGAIKQTLDGIDRVATIVRAMKAFGFTSNDDKAPAALNEAIGNTLVVASSELKYVADVETDFGDLPPVWCHIGDINQVVLNLVVNAAHAITSADNGRGTIRVSTQVDDDHVVIAVKDSGTGIPPEVADKVFEAFFTTKEVGSGTGQGLGLCRNLVMDRHGGTIDFTTEMGAGTTFTVRLPIGSSGESELEDLDNDRVGATA